jgi:enoyl-CoA hydratase
MVDGTSPSPLTVEWHDSVALLTITRPERRNAVNLSTLRAIREAQIDVVDKGGRAMVITGAAPAFCAGADLSGGHEEEFASALHDVLHGMTTMPIVTVASIDGPALGAGAQIAVSCDIRVATAISIIGVPAAKLGLVVNHWTVERLVRELSWPVARAMLLTARLYSGAELAQIGSVHRIGDLSEALSWAREIAALAPLTIAGHKLALEVSASNLQMNELVTEARERAWASSDAIEGRKAFLEKRPPKFIGS